MRKIPTLFVRDPDDRRYVLPEVTPGCEWVLQGEGVATRKYDGTCCMVRDGQFYARREVKPGKATPPDFEPVGHDDTTGKTVGWVPVGDGPEWKAHREAWERDAPLGDGTYELLGPKVNGDPEHMGVHTLLNHEATQLLPDSPRDFQGLRLWLLDHDYEGIVWHHTDGRMVKLKKRDFGK